MPKMRKSIEISAPVGDVFAYVSNPENLPEIWPSLLEVSNLKLKADGGHSYDWVYKMAGMRFHGHLDTVEFQPGRLIVSKNEKGIRSTFRWSFQGRDDTTVFTNEVDYEIPGGLLAKLAEPFVRALNEREADTFNANLKARLEGAMRAVQTEAHPNP